MTMTLAKTFGILSIAMLAACGGSGSNPVSGGDSDDGSATDGGTDPNANLTDAAFLFDTSKNLIANSFVFNPGDTPGTGTISINNLPFDGVSSDGGEYTPRPGVVLPNGTLYQNNPRIEDGVQVEDQYYAVVMTSADGNGTLVGTVATNTYADATRSFGGAYVSRTSRGLPPSQAAVYSYNGTYVGLRIIRQTALPGQARDPNNNVVQPTTGDAELILDLQDRDNQDNLRGAIRGDIVNRVLYDLDGNPLGPLSDIQLVITGYTADTLQTNDGTTVTQNANGSVAQTGEWTGLISGPNGEELAGFLLLEGNLADTDPNYVDIETGPLVSGRETGGFIATR